MDKNNRPGFSNRSVDDLLEQQLNSMRYQNAEVPEYSVDPVFMPGPTNSYYPEQFTSTEARNTLPFVFNTREDVVPAMVGMGGGNYMVFGTSPTEKNVNVPNMHFANKNNASLSGVNNYQVEYPANYNLFTGGINSMAPSFSSSSEGNAPSSPHLIDNLVGHWGSDHSGTYSPFGSCIPSNDFKNVVHDDRGTKKTRMVAEVRPMRPSYSDVLSKSVSSQPKIGKPIEGKLREVKEVKNGRTAKSSVGRSLSGSGNMNGRLNLSADDCTRSGSNSSLKTAGVKKSTDVEPEEPLTKKWVSLDDLTAGISESDFMNNEKTKKSNLKHNISKKVKDGWETIQLSNGKSPSGKQSSSKKAAAAPSVSKVQNGTKEREVTPGVKVEQTRIKVVAEERRGPVPNQTKVNESAKGGRRNSRGLQSERVKRTGRVRRRDADPGWLALIAQRADILVAYVIWAARWFVSLVLDVFALSTNLSLYMCTVFWSSSVNSVTENYRNICNWFRGLSLTQRFTSSRFWPFSSSEKPASSDSDSESDSGESDGKKKKKRLPGGLKHNLPLPSTGDEAMKRLLACKGKDPYSILGVSQDCTDDDIKRYYKRQAFLVHPDKNNQPGAEEAFKILVHAFDLIGEPEHRKTYDRSVEKSAQAAQAWSELSELLAQLHKKMEYVANTIRCTNCGKRHKRSSLNRPIYAARMCAQCKICHSVREGDIWAETSMFGMIWRYYACMDGGVYDISEWAACQGNHLKNLKANTHQVQYRIVLGKQANKNRSQQPVGPSEPDLEEFINNLYSKPESGAPSDIGAEGGARTRKHKRKK